MRSGLCGGAALLAMAFVAACSTPYGKEAPAENDSMSAHVTAATDPSPPDDSKTMDADGGAGSAGSAGGEGGAPAPAADPASCPAKEPVGMVPWRQPPQPSSACSAADITYFAQIAPNESWNGVESLMRARNSACSKCIFSQGDDTTWRAVIFYKEGTFVNYGACYARAIGGSEACGHSYYDETECYYRVCGAAACGSDAAVDACYKTQGAADACKKYSPTTACGGAAALASIENVCHGYVDVARVLCSN